MVLRQKIFLITKMKLKDMKLFIFTAFIFSLSCTPYRQIPYFKDLAKDTVEIINNFSPLTMQPGDLLGIDVVSLNHEADLIFNYHLERQPTNNHLDRTEQTAVVGYLIDQNGNINVPTIGLIKVSGYTTEEISNKLKSKLEIYLSQPVVNVRLLNFKISVLGDVKNPGSYNIQNEKITLIEALSLAGDLNTTGKRNNVLIVREKDGNREYMHLNLNSKDVFNSPYFYLENNDVLYVQPNRVKASSDAASVQKISVVISALFLIAYLITNN